MQPTTTAAAQPYRPRETLLKNRAARSGSFGVHGRAAVTLGGLLVTTPIVAMALAGGEIIVRPLATWNVRWWLAAYMTAFVVTAGLAVLVHGVRDLRRAARVERRRAANAYQRYITAKTSDRETRTNVQCFELYRDTAPAEQVVTEAGTRAPRVRFTIPADAPTTELSSRPCRYWEVDVEAPTDGVDYAARFLVQVY